MKLLMMKNPYYAELTELPGVWASGKSLEECRKNLADVIEGWVLLRLSRGMPIPPRGEIWIDIPKELAIA